MVEYRLGRGWPRRSAYDNFDEDSWMEGVRKRLRSALYTPTNPTETHTQLEEARESEHIDEENEMQEDPSAKNHVRLTSEAMQELFTLGGVIDQDSGSSVLPCSKHLTTALALISMQYYGTECALNLKERRIGERIEYSGL